MVLTHFLEAFSGAPGAFVLDLGCGTGRHAQTLREAGYRVCAVDPDEDAVSTARALYPETDASRIDFCVARGEALPLRAAAVDAVVCVDVLHWTEDAAALAVVWKEAWRVLRPGGLFFGRLRIAPPIGSNGRRREAAEVPVPSDPWTRILPAALEGLVAETGGAWLLPLEKTEDSAVFHVHKPR
jgi:SAM-dependent methyltransferase